MRDVAIVGGGLAGLAAAAALAGAGYRTRVFEARRYLGGRATSYSLGSEPAIDNCQHILLGCCVNLLDFYRRLGVEHHIQFHREFSFIEPGGRVSRLKAGALPAPLHFAGSFPRLRFLSLGDKAAIARAMLAIRSAKTGSDDISMADWLRAQRQPARAIERFWRPVLVSAINEELDRIAVSHGFQVFRLGFLSGARGSRMGIPAVPLGELYGEAAWRRIANVELHVAAPVRELVIENGEIRGLVTDAGRIDAQRVVVAVPFEKAAGLLPPLGIEFAAFEHSPITGIHLWFDRPVTTLPHASLLDRTIQWMFNKNDGRYLQLVVSASRSLSTMPRADVIALALAELAEFFPEVRGARLEQAHVVKEMRATYAAKPGLEAHRPRQTTAVRGLYLAGDWTRSGWPATMEGAVRSGYLAAEAVTAGDGAPRRFLLADIA